MTHKTAEKALVAEGHTTVASGRTRPGVRIRLGAERDLFPSRIPTEAFHALLWSQNVGLVSE